MQPGKLPQPGIRTFRQEERGDERIASDHQVGEGAELHDLILVTGRFGIAVLLAVGCVGGPGLALPRMACAARVDKLGIAHMLGNIEVREGLDCVCVAVIETRWLQTMALLKRGMPFFWVIVTSSAQQMWCPFASVRQSDGAAETCKDTDCTILVGSAGL